MKTNCLQNLLFLFLFLSLGFTSSAQAYIELGKQNQELRLLPLQGRHEIPGSDVEKVLQTLNHITLEEEAFQSLDQLEHLLGQHALNKEELVLDYLIPVTKDQVIVIGRYKKQKGYALLTRRSP